jgi:SAM-dependent methyltransferase
VTDAVDAAFRNSAPQWFRARTTHEYDVVRQRVGRDVALERARILDFGCGELPVAAASFALRHPASSVTGCDVLALNARVLESSLREHAGQPVPSNLQVLQAPPNGFRWTGEPFDLVYSWSVFEHIPSADIRTNFALIRDCLAPGGVFFFQIGGLYFHTSGSHLGSVFPDEPWHHLTRSLDELESVVMSQPMAQDARLRLWRQFVELNRLTAEDFLDAAADAGLVLQSHENLRDKAHAPPARLLRSHTLDALVTSEIRAVFRAA